MRPLAKFNPNSRRFKALPKHKPKWKPENKSNHPIVKMKMEGGERWQKHLEMLRSLSKRNHRPKGVPDGWGKQLKRLKKFRSLVRVNAENKVKQMVEKGLIPEDDEIAKRAVTVLLELAEGPDSATVKASSAKALLEFTKQKPVNKLEVKAVAEEWLASLDGIDESTESETKTS